MTEEEHDFIKKKILCAQIARRRKSAAFREKNAQVYTKNRPERVVGICREINVWDVLVFPDLLIKMII